MSQNDKPKLDELQKLLRRLERVELEKAEQRATGEAAAAVGTVPATQGTPGAMPAKPDGASPVEGQQVGGPHSGANGARLGPASTDEAAGKSGGRAFIAKQQPDLETPAPTNPEGSEAGISQSHEKQANENQAGEPQATVPKATGIRTNSTGPRNNGHDASALKSAESAAAATGPAGERPSLGSQKAVPEGGDKQHLARMVYRGTARDLPRVDGPEGEQGRTSQRFPQASPGAASPGAFPNALPDQSPFQLPAIPDSRSRDITHIADEKARSGSSIGVVLVAAITAAVVSTVAAVLITIWVIRGGGFGGQLDPVLTASRNTPPVAEAGGTTRAKADATSATDAATAPSTPGAGASEPPSADAPPEGPRTSPGEVSQPAGDDKASASAGVAVAEPADAEVSAQSIAAAIASDEPAQVEPAPQPETDVSAAAAVEDPGREASGETSESASTPVDLAAIPDTAPEPDKSETVSAQTESDSQPGPATEADTANEAEPQRDGDPPALADAKPETLAATGEAKANEPVAPADSDAPAPERAADTSTQSQTPSQPSEQPTDQQTDPAGEALATGSPDTEAPAISNADQTASSLNPDRQVTDIAPADPALGRGDALAFNDSRATPPAENTAAFSAPEPRAPYELHAPTQLEVAPDASFEFPLRIEARTGSLDNHFLIVSGLKRGARFSHGVELMFDTWQVRADKLDELRLTIPKGFARELPLTIELRRPDGMSVVRANLLLTAPGSAERLGLPESLYEQEASTLPDDVLAKVRQGERAIDNGNLRGARLALQEAALQTSAVAALLLAMSYDPRHVDKFGTASGNDIDVAAARQWYGRASSFGADIATTLARGL